MTQKEKQLARISLRDDQPLEIHFRPFPEPAPELLKLPGMAKLLADMKLMRESDVESLQRMVLRLQRTLP